ncbi:MAG: hypothetical protein R3B82_19705 [Sandaracinaceae bacterium]
MADAAVPMGDFEVRVEHAGLTLEEGGELPVEFGCQGGAHVELDVLAVDEVPMRDATVRVEVLGGPMMNDTTLRLEETATGAEVRSMISPFGDFMTFISPGDFAFPIDATLRVTVTARNGSAVTLERGVTLVMGGSCTCTRNDPLPGTATVSAFTVEGTATGCDVVSIGLDLAFAADDPDAFHFNEFPTHHDFFWPAECVDALGLAAGAELRLDALDSFPGSPCSPPMTYGDLVPSDFGCACVLAPPPERD